jgi:hypothetical protein
MKILNDTIRLNITKPRLQQDKLLKDLRNLIHWYLDGKVRLRFIKYLEIKTCECVAPRNINLVIRRKRALSYNPQPL